MSLETSNVCAAVLAAGLSKRFKGANKLLAEFEGTTVIAASVSTLIGLGLKDVVVVTGHKDAEIAHALEGLPVRNVFNPAHRSGMASSIKAGVRALPLGFEAVLIALGDMPRVEAGTVAALIAALSQAREKSIAIPVHKGKRGNPVLWRQGMVPYLERISGDTGGREIISAHPADVLEVEVDDPGIFFDVDTNAALD